MTELSQLSLYNQAIILFAALVLFTSFIMLAQARMLPLIFAFAWQGMLLAVVTALVALVSGHPHLYISAALTVALKVFLIPWLLYRLAVKLNIHLEAEAIKYPSLLLLGGRGAGDFQLLRGAADRAPFGAGHAQHHRGQHRRGAARHAADDRAQEGGRAGDRLHVDRERAVLRRGGFDLRHADDRRAGRGLRRAGGGDPVRRVLLSDARVVRLARRRPPQPPVGSA